MMFKIEEAKSVPKRNRKQVRESKYDPIIEACMSSSTGIITVTLDSIKDAQKVGTSLHHYLKTRNLLDLFKVQQRREHLYVTDMTRRSA